MAIIGANQSSGTRVTLTTNDTDGYTETGSNTNFTLVENSANISRQDNAVTSSGMEIAGDGFSVVVMNEGGVFGAGGRGAGQPGNSSNNGEAGAPAFTAAPGTKVFNWPGGTITGGGGGGGRGGNGATSPGGTSPAHPATTTQEVIAAGPISGNICGQIFLHSAHPANMSGSYITYNGSNPQGQPLPSSQVPFSEQFPGIQGVGANRGTRHCTKGYGPQTRGRGSGWFVDSDNGRCQTCLGLGPSPGRNPIGLSCGQAQCQVSRSFQIPGCPGGPYGTKPAGTGAIGGNGGSFTNPATAGGNGTDGATGQFVTQNHCGGNPSPAFTQPNSGAGGDGGNGGALGSGGVAGFAGYALNQSTTNPSPGGTHGGSGPGGGSAGAAGGRITGGGVITDLN